MTIETLEYAFGFSDGVVIFSANTSEEAPVTDGVIPDLPNPHADTIYNGKVYGVALEGDIPEATFAMQSEAKTVSIILFDPPADLDIMPEDAVLCFPIGDEWAFVEKTDTFYTQEEYHFGQISNMESKNSVGDTADAAVQNIPQTVSTLAALVYLNDAIVLGTPTSAMQEVMDRPATFLIGQMYASKKGQTTQDGGWAGATMPLKDWIAGAPAMPNAPAWGFSRHPEGKSKEGSCIVFGNSVEGARKAKAMSNMYAIGVDIDSGASLSAVVDMLVTKNIFAIIYTSYNHKRRGIDIQRDDVIRKMKLTGEPTLADVKNYLILHAKNRYEPAFIDAVTILDANKQTSTGIVIALDTPALDKFRIVFPLKEPVSVPSLAHTQDKALDIWANKITGLAARELGLSFDISCTDPSRLFFTARHAAGAEHYTAIIQGEPIDFNAIQAYSKNLYARARGISDDPVLRAFQEASEGVERSDVPMSIAPDGTDLNKWNYAAGQRFMVTDFLAENAADKLRKTGGETEGKTHVECPFESEHSSAGGFGCYTVNAENGINGHWIWHCSHNACTGRHRLEFVKKALEDGWFETDALLDPVYLLPAPDEELEEDEEEEEPEGSIEGEVVVPKTYEEIAEGFTTKTTEAEIRSFLKRALSRMDLVEKARVIDKLVENTALSKTGVNEIIKGLKKDKKKGDEEDPTAESLKSMVVNQRDFLDLCQYGKERISSANMNNPHIFHYMSNLCVIRENSEGRASMKFLDKDGFAHALNNITRWARVGGEGDAIGVSAPPDVVSYLFAADYGTYPALRGVVSTPVFTKEADLLTTAGYHRESGLYYNPEQSFNFLPVSKVPTESEVTEAKRLLIEESYADFPLGGMVRNDIVEKTMSGESVPAVANLMAMTLLPFMREMVSGPTPGHLLVKSTPGTGASLLTDVFSIIATGTVTPAMAMPTNKDEMSKTLTSVLANGQNVVFFDNINHSVDSGELASAMTAPTYQARILGRSQTVEVDVRCVWIMTGNNVTLSSELVRRLVMIDLDAQMANPEMRSGFRHDDIRTWAQENRNKLVWACLTLIQNYIAKGQEKATKNILASYENWSRVMGGVLEAANINGFLDNRDELKSRANDDTSDDFLILLQGWWDTFQSAPVLIKGPSSSAGTKSTDIVGMIEAQEIILGGLTKKTTEGEYLPRDVARIVGKNQDRVVALLDGTEVVVKKSEKRTKHGITWYLVKTSRE